MWSWIHYVNAKGRTLTAEKPLLIGLLDQVSSRANKLLLHETTSGSKMQNCQC